MNCYYAQLMCNVNCYVNFIDIIKKGWLKSLFHVVGFISLLLRHVIAIAINLIFNNNLITFFHAGTSFVIGRFEILNTNV